MELGEKVSVSKAQKDLNHWVKTAREQGILLTEDDTETPVAVLLSVPVFLSIQAAISGRQYGTDERNQSGIS